MEFGVISISVLWVLLFKSERGARLSGDNVKVSIGYVSGTNVALRLDHEPVLFDTWYRVRYVC